jgi:hypothetical protein
VTIATHPTPNITTLELGIYTLNTSSTSVFPSIAYLVSQFPSLGDQGVSGYSFFTPGSSDLLGSPVPIAGIILLMSLQDAKSPDTMMQIWAPIISHIKTTWPDLTWFNTTAQFPSYFGWFETFYDKFTAGKDEYIGSRLLDRAALTANVSALQDTLERMATGSIAAAYLVGGKGVQNAKPRGGSNAVVPAWRKAYVHASKLNPITPASVAPC